MPFGKYKGRPMHMVPARYLLFLLSQDIKGPVRNYINKNISTIQQNHRDYLLLKDTYR
jgi:uncharacterized protein (DUF3820 family)